MLKLRRVILRVKENGNSKKEKEKEKGKYFEKRVF